MTKILGIVLVWALQVYSYMGILNDAANRSSTTMPTSSKNSSSSTALVGGAHLDVLAITWFVQFGSVLWTPKCFYVLMIIPFWAGYTLYRTFYPQQGTKDGVSLSSEDNDAMASDNHHFNQQQDKRQKRSEKRRQKWN